MHGDVQGRMFLRGGSDRGLGRARRHAATAIADRAARGRPHPSTRSRSGSPRPCGSRQAPSISARSGRRRAASANTARQCGGHLMTNHPLLGLVDVYAATLPTLKFRPAVHINYAETVLPMRDGLPKLKDFPAEFGGSGEQVRGVAPTTSGRRRGDRRGRRGTGRRPSTGICRSSEDACRPSRRRVGRTPEPRPGPRGR